ncbi:hypothetical protein ACHAWT_001899 [Skeletonema menzelii]
MSAPNPKAGELPLPANLLSTIVLKFADGSPFFGGLLSQSELHTLQSPDYSMQEAELRLDRP